MTPQSFDAKGTTRQGYLALPAGGKGHGVLVLHSWWGLNEVFRNVCDRLAKEGFVAFAPDLHNGIVTAKREEAQKIVETQDLPAVSATAQGGLAYLRSHPATVGKQAGAIAFSFGGSFTVPPYEAGAFQAIVIFYDDWSAQNFSKSKAHFQFHFAEDDEFVPQDIVKNVKGDNAEVYIYPGTHLGSSRTIAPKITKPMQPSWLGNVHLRFSKNDYLGKHFPAGTISAMIC
jgi:carboxymethylenebutenolidase